MSTMAEKMFTATSANLMMSSTNASPSGAWEWSGKPKVSSEEEVTATLHQALLLSAPFFNLFDAD